MFSFSVMRSAFCLPFIKIITVPVACLVNSLTPQENVASVLVRLYLKIFVRPPILLCQMQSSHIFPESWGIINLCPHISPTTEVHVALACEHALDGRGVWRTTPPPELARSSHPIYSLGSPPLGVADISTTTHFICIPNYKWYCKSIGK